MTNFPLRVILADLRSTANVGSIIRTSDATGVELVVAAGYTPYPRLENQPDDRPPHVAHANTKAIAKTALGAEHQVPIMHTASIAKAIAEARHQGFTIIMVEQAKNSLNITSYQPTGPLALVLGAEVEGLAPEILALGDITLEIPMIGKKESYGVAIAAGIALHYLRFGHHS